MTRSKKIFSCRNMEKELKSYHNKQFEQILYVSKISEYCWN